MTGQTLHAGHWQLDRRHRANTSATINGSGGYSDVLGTGIGVTASNEVGQAATGAAHAAETAEVIRRWAADREHRGTRCQPSTMAW